MAIVRGTSQDEALAGAGDGDPIFGFGDKDWDDRHLLGNITHAALWANTGWFPRSAVLAARRSYSEATSRTREAGHGRASRHDEHSGANGGRRRPASPINRRDGFWMAVVGRDLGRSAAIRNACEERRDQRGYLTTNTTRSADLTRIGAGIWPTCDLVHLCLARPAVALAPWQRRRRFDHDAPQPATT
jgi:hypothetical protein